MKNTIIRIFTTIIVLTCLVNFVGVEYATASSLWEKQEGLGKVESNYGSEENIGSAFGATSSSTKDPRVIAVRIVKFFLTFLGIIMTCIIMWGGYVWMTAGGNSDKVDKAKQTIIRAVIGIVIILASYFITVIVTECSMDIIDGSALICS